MYNGCYFCMQVTVALSSVFRIVIIVQNNHLKIITCCSGDFFLRYRKVVTGRRAFFKPRSNDGPRVIFGTKCIGHGRSFEEFCWKSHVFMQ